MRIPDLLPGVLLIIFTLSITGCGSDSPTGDGADRIEPEKITENAPGELKTTFEVEWGESTHVLSANDVRDITVDTNTGTYYLPSDVKAAESLGSGDIVVFTGVGFHKVESVSLEGDERAIRTTDALLTEAIRNGTVGFEFTPDFEQATPEGITQQRSAGGAGRSAFDPSATISAKLAKFDFSLEVGCANPDELSVKVTGKDPAGVTEFSLTGEVSEFTGKGEFRIIDHELKSFSYLIRDVNARLTKEMTIGNEPLTLETGYLPVTLFKFPFLVGPLPMQLTFPLGFAADAVIPIGGKVTAKSTTDYNVDVGYIFEPPASMEPIYVEKSVSQTEEEAEYVPNAAGSAAYAIAFPRVEWSFVGLEENAAYYVHLAYRLWANYSQNDLAGNTCREAGRTFAGVGGFYADLFGLAKGEWFVQMFAIDDKFFSEGCD